MGRALGEETSRLVGRSSGLLLGRFEVRDEQVRQGGDRRLLVDVVEFEVAAWMQRQARISVRSTARRCRTGVAGETMGLAVVGGHGRPTTGQASQWGRYR